MGPRKGRGAHQEPCTRVRALTCRRSQPEAARHPGHQRRRTPRSDRPAARPSVRPRERKARFPLPPPAPRTPSLRGAQGLGVIESVERNTRGARLGVRSRRRGPASRGEPGHPSWR
ncbi:hypothetical protein SCOCK_110061 [Actinacidiphila cocklensis]|uniref:Uncharacterized protein n=1 Tax=Actinacidiphila cocklensis TaxID=887465 RepID=A0A9W4DK83_9ACTN|nr:hypothetical protein SCOCK_110061 [Actinacidiphila cocklensis]